MTNLVWFRNDLRVYDNPALTKGMSNGPCIGVFYLTDEQWNEHGLALIQRQLMMEQLKNLEKSLSQLNVPLIIVDGQSFAKSIQKLIKDCKKWNISDVFFNHEYGINEQSYTKQVESCLSEQGITTHGFHEQCIITPGLIKNGQGEDYKVFSAFKKKWLLNLSQQARPLYTKPNTQDITTINSDIRYLKEYNIFIPASDQRLLNETHIHEYLDDFINSKVSNYHLERDIPDLNSTSQLSTHLALGVITTRQCLQALLNSRNNRNSYSADSLNEGSQCWLNELIWREFYRHVMVAFPRVSRGKAFKLETERVPWKSENPSFIAWCNGLTGIPIVDAAMRQLNQTGWMHNRLRMITAMFLTKHLHIDWRLGEQYFYSKLSDADLASNNGGWQWSASTGVDAVPYFRIFNPYRQAERFDPNGDFVRKYVKELANIKGKAALKPNEKLARSVKYPTPIVDLKIAADITKTYFKQLKRQPVTEGKTK